MHARGSGSSRVPSFTTTYTHTPACVCVFITNMFWPSIRNTFTGLSLSRTSAAGKSRIPVSGNFCRQCFIGFRFFLNAFIFVPFFLFGGVFLALACTGLIYRGPYDIYAHA